MIYFTADLHLGHKNIIHYCDRPFSSIEEHDTVLMDNWNAVVREDDEIYILGDFMRGRIKEDIENTLRQLNGIKFLICGNHDRPEFCRGYFEWVRTYHEMTAYNKKWILFHYPILEWDGWYRSDETVHLYGHVHNHAEKPDAPFHLQVLNTLDRCFNVGVDVNGYTPVSIKALLQRLILSGDNSK
jgi:calcineurin-like phosphoesterase family protein